MWLFMRISSLLFFFLGFLCVSLLAMASPRLSFAQSALSNDRISCTSPGYDSDAFDGRKYHPVSMTCKNDCKRVPYTDCVDRTRYLLGLFGMTFIALERTCYCTIPEKFSGASATGAIAGLYEPTGRDLHLASASKDFSDFSGDAMVVVVDRACTLGGNEPNPYARCVQ